MRPRAVVLSQRHLDAVVEHAWSAYPAEAIGVLAGTAGLRVRAVHPLPNVGGERTFDVPPAALYALDGALRRRRQRMIATYHSHPEGGAWLSDADIAHVFDTAPIAVVIALSGRGRLVDAAAFGRERGRIFSVDLDVVPDRRRPPPRVRGRVSP